MNDWARSPYLGVEEGVSDFIQVSGHDEQSLEAGLHLTAAGAQPHQQAAVPLHLLYKHNMQR